MKIPETTPNVGAYYGNEENGQWQPNGVIIDSGVAGGVVGSGDGLHPPPVYPVHIPRGHIPGECPPIHQGHVPGTCPVQVPQGYMPGYVMAGAYYAGAGYPAAPPDDFADYMWMENEEEFDKQVMQQLEEEALMEQCIEAMLEDEQRERHRPVNGHAHYPTTSNGNPSLSLAEAVSRSTLNPYAAEFVPTRARPPAAEDKKTTEVKSTEEPQKEPSEETTEETPQVTEEVKTEETLPPVDPPEVSAADVQPIDKKKDIKKDAKTKPEPKKAVKAEPKKAKPVAVKSETKVQPKKKEVKAVKSETKAEEREREEAPVVVAEVLKVQAPAAPVTEEPAGPKPINYAAAAKANKPKKPSPTPPTVEKTPPPTLPPKDKLKEKKPAVQRKNSAK
ncbi:uncharacterized protein isoform X2 [Choristoneura fumiferana]|uniref:uncharacterized protein isoform X2 n=1 Tax=Choristoneura fumiferana TaxID=7141 RepID=UPI003D157835